MSPSSADPACSSFSLVGDIVTGEAIRAGMVARIPRGPDVFIAVPILAVEFVDHMAEKTSGLALHVGNPRPRETALQATSSAPRRAGSGSSAHPPLIWGARQQFGSRHDVAAIMRTPSAPSRFDERRGDPLRERPAPC